LTLFAHRRFAGWLVGAGVLAGTLACLEVQAQAAPSAPVQNLGGRSWASLSPAQQTALQPLQREWNGIEPSRKIKWIEIADRFSTYPPAEQARIQGRMAEWARLSGRERGQTRLNFREAQQQMTAEQRKAKWEAYNALPPEQRQQLAARALPASAPTGQRASPRRDGASLSKSNIVPATTATTRVQSVAPSVTQALPGASTNLLTKRPAPPAHQQSGSPKIVTSSVLVDSSTLLPKAKSQPKTVAQSTPAPAASSPSNP
jgi:hypothetical protein